jgi:hypothetical protein
MNRRRSSVLVFQAARPNNPEDQTIRFIITSLWKPQILHIMKGIKLRNVSTCFCCYYYYLAKRPLGRTKYEREDNIRMDLT